MAVSSGLLIWNPARKQSGPALYRYFLVHMAGGVLFLVFILLSLHHNHSLLLTSFRPSPLSWLLFTAFAINAAVTPFHTWMTDAYPESTPGAGVFLSVFTSKIAVYCFARCFAGTSILTEIGLFMAVYGVIYALMENDIRRLLSYHIICQVGYMLYAIGIGTPLAISGAIFHAAGNILFKGLLFMAAGSIYYGTGKTKLTNLGGLGREWPLLLVFYGIGALAISGFPFLNGFISKSLITDAAKSVHDQTAYVLLYVVAAGTFLSVGLKLGYYAFAGDKKAAVVNQNLPACTYAAMGLVAAACAVIGIFPERLLNLLPASPLHSPLTLSHIVPALQLLAGTLIMFTCLQPMTLPHRGINLDLDWFYRWGANAFLKYLCNPIKNIHERIQENLSTKISAKAKQISARASHTAETPATGFILMWVTCGLTVLLIAFLRVYGKT